MWGLKQNQRKIHGNNSTKKRSRETEVYCLKITLFKKTIKYHLKINFDKLKMHIVNYGGDAQEIIGKR